MQTNKSYAQRQQLISLSVLAHLITAFFSKGFYHIDEHVQLLEFAGLKMGLTTMTELPWEYHYKMRTSLLPALVIGLEKISSLFTTFDPFVLSTDLRFISAIFSFSVTYFFVRTFLAAIPNNLIKIFYLLSFFLWCNIYLNVRFSSENWGGNFFILGLCLVFNTRQNWKLKQLLVGLCFGFSFLCRFQMGIAIAGLLGWLFFIQRQFSKKDYFLISIGIAITLIVGSLLDLWFYEEWCIPWWNYFRENILLHKVNNFGKESIWFYFIEILANGLPPFSILILIGLFCLWMKQPKSWLSWVTFPFFLVHLLIGHKELRFLFPLAKLLPLIVLAGWLPLSTWLSRKKIFFKKFQQSFLILNFVMILIVMFKPSHVLIDFYQKIYYAIKEETSLYFLPPNPYEYVVSLNFYKRENLHLKKVNKLAEIDHDQEVKGQKIFAVSSSHIKQQEVIALIADKELLVQSFPAWLLKFNFNHWVERSSFWQVYR